MSKSNGEIFLESVSTLIDNDIVDYQFIRQNQLTKQYQKVTVRFYVTDLDKEEAEELKGEQLV